MPDLVSATRWLRDGPVDDLPEPLTDDAGLRLLDRRLFGITCLLAAAACVVVLPSGHRFSAAAPVAVVLLLVSMRFQLHLSVGWIGCQQAVFVFLLFTVPLNLVSVVAIACLVACESPPAQRPVGRLLAAGCNSWYALVAATLLAMLAPHAAEWHHWPIYVAIFGGQFAATAAIYNLRVRLMGKPVMLAEDLTVLLVDASLTPIGLAAAVDLHGAPGAAVAIMIGTTVLLGLIDHEHGLRRMESARALRDPLTGLANRALFAETCAACESRCRRKGEHAALLLIDLDDFKRVNDTLGHQAGDEVLARFAQALSRGLRSEDLPARIGGDEFAVVLAEPMDLDGARHVARNLREKLAEPITLANGESVELHFSVGLSLIGAETSSEDASAQADIALYADKRARKQ